jgi:uncharacterized protein
MTLFGITLTPGAIVLIVLVFTVATTVQSITGFGSVVVSGPFLVMIDPRFVPGPVLVAGVVMSVFILLRNPIPVGLGDVVRMNLGRAIGAATGALVLLHLSEEVTAATMAGMLLAIVALSLLGFRATVTRRTLVLTGTFAGVADTVAGLAGSATALLLQTERGSRLRGSLAAYLLPGALISLIAIALSGRFGRAELALFVLLLPGLALGIMIAGRFGGVLDRYVSRGIVLGISTLASITVLVRFFLLGSG